MQLIKTFVAGAVIKAPVLTDQHVVAFHRIQSGQRISCDPRIINDLRAIGWIKEAQHGGQN